MTERWRQYDGSIRQSLSRGAQQRIALPNLLTDDLLESWQDVRRRFGVRPPGDGYADWFAEEDERNPGTYIIAGNRRARYVITPASVDWSLTRTSGVLLGQSFKQWFETESTATITYNGTQYQPSTGTDHADLPFANQRQMVVNGDGTVHGQDWHTPRVIVADPTSGSPGYRDSLYPLFYNSVIVDFFTDTYFQPPGTLLGAGTCTNQGIAAVSMQTSTEGGYDLWCTDIDTSTLTPNDSGWQRVMYWDWYDPNRNDIVGFTPSAPLGSPLVFLVTEHDAGATTPVGEYVPYASEYISGAVITLYVDGSIAPPLAVPWRDGIFPGGVY